jgi:hypothetical protein
MKDSTKQAKELLAKLAPLKLGDKLQFDGFLTGLGIDQPVDAHCTEIEMNKFWQFALYWNSIFIQNVVVEHLPGELVIDTLGA